MSNFKSKLGFTFIELLLSLAILAILFIPVMQLFSQSLYSTSYSRELITATNLAKWQMEKLKNLNYTKEEMKKMGSTMYPSPDEPPLTMNGLTWRIHREIIKDTDPLEVRVSVFLDEKSDKSLITLVTLMEDKTWIEYTPVK